MNEEKFFQARRLVFLLKKLQAGIHYTAKELQTVYLRDGLGDYSIRTIQNDLLLLSEIEPLLQNKKEGREKRWFIERQGFRQSHLLFSSNLLSLYVLKAQLKSFKGTFIEKELNSILEKIEKDFPNDIFSYESLFWDKNIGNYNYEKIDDLIKGIIEAISQNLCLEVKYDTAQEGIIKSYICQIKKIFTYGGFLYAAAYVPRYGYYIALAIHRIKVIKQTTSQEIEVPEFDLEEFSSIRFGVFWGEPEKIILEIKKKYVKYFENRFWHQTQKLESLKNGNMILKMEVPLSPELVSWILSWGEGIKVIEPAKLKEKILKKLKDTISNY